MTGGPAKLRRCNAQRKYRNNHIYLLNLNVTWSFSVILKVISLVKKMTDAYLIKQLHQQAILYA